jgi:hypothetical protein
VRNFPTRAAYLQVHLLDVDGRNIDFEDGHGVRIKKKRVEFTTRGGEQQSVGTPQAARR